MYYHPHDIVKREYGDKEFVNFLEKASAKIDLIVNFGSWLFMWCSKNDSLTSDEKIILLALLRRALEIIDSISILVRHSSIDTCKILLRSLLELLFEIEYLTTTDSQRKSICFIVWNLNQQLKIKKSFDSAADEGKQFYEAIKRDKYLKNLKLTKPANLDEEIQTLSEILETYPEISREYHKTNKNRKGRDFPWYAMFKGPRNAWELSGEIDLTGFYVHLFSYLSKTTHSEDILEEILKPSDLDSVINIIQIRSPGNLKFVITYTITFALGLFNILIDHFFPRSLYAKQQFQSFYEKEIKSFYFTNIKINL